MANKEIEHAIENELQNLESEFIAANKAYVAEIIAWRLERDGFLRAV